jgi:hypothetical protein
VRGSAHRGANSERIATRAKCPIDHGPRREALAGLTRAILTVGRCVGSPKHASAHVANPDRDHQRNKGLLLSEDADRLGRAFTLRRRLLAEAPHVPFNLVGGVLSFVRRATFDVFDQARNIPLQYDKILANQCDIGIRVHRCAHDLQVSHRPEILR